MERRFSLALLLGVVSVFTLSLGAQQPTRATSLPPSQPSARRVLPGGTVVRLHTGRALSSKDARTGEPLELEVMRDVKVGDLLVIPRHTPAVATVIRVQRSRRLWRGGNLALELKAVNAITGDAVPVRATKAEKGGPTADEKTRAFFEGYAIFFLPELVRKGDEAVLPRGSEIDAFVDGDVSLDTVRLRDSIASFEAKATAARAAARTDKARVHLYGTYRDLGRGKHIIDLDERPLVGLRGGRFFNLQLPPGNHAFRCVKSRLNLELKSDEDYYIRVISKTGWALHFLLTVVPSEQGEDEIYALTPADRTDVFDQASPVAPTERQP